ncbi:MAG: phenylalanine--tRNA ligase subunit alpha [Deltaproteobacteria bacterium]|nr:phenylalanine--tRNA ligase subunit alpha [Deltaproteobacteria bacterium]
MERQLEEIKSSFKQTIEKAGNKEELEKIRVEYLGRKGVLTTVLRKMGAIDPKERPRIGRLSNQLKSFMQESLSAKLKEMESAKGESGLDVTLPGRTIRRGRVHILNQVLAEIEDIFIDLGFSVVSGPEVEDAYHNFEALNMPLYHPARDMQATFYFSDNILLRTQTSPVQIRVMEKDELPIRVIAPGKVYRSDSDVSHTPMFHQVEGLWVEEGITFAHLKGVLEAFVHALFGLDVPMRFRPSFFPFTEPSAEVDMGCVICRGKGCRVCGYTGWLEILGSGMVDPVVFDYVGIDPEKGNGER